MAKAPRPSSPYSAARAHVCGTEGTRVFARFAHVQQGAVATRRTLAGSGAPECVFRTLSKGRPVTVSVSVDGAPQAYGVLERQGEEAAQVFGSSRLAPAPQSVFHLGLAAFWYPGSSQRQRRALGIALARRYLGPSKPNLIRSDG